MVTIIVIRKETQLSPMEEYKNQNKRMLRQDSKGSSLMSDKMAAYCNNKKSMKDMARRKQVL